MTEQNFPKEEIKEEFSKMGENMKMLFNSAWESDERNQAAEDIRDGLNEVSNTLNEYITNFHETKPGQKLSDNINKVNQKIQDAEIGDTLVDALKKVNEELSKAAAKFTSGKAASEEVVDAEVNETE